MTHKDTKGTRDLHPEYARRKEHIKATIRRTVEQYGFHPIQTPVIESAAVLTSKFTGGEEILKEIYTLEDQGRRSLGLRYDLTVPLARFMAENPQLKLPFKRYQSGPVFRDGPIKKGRYREFEQFDADIVGDGTVFAEAELLRVVSTVFSELGVKAEIQVNSRTLLKKVLRHADVPENKHDGAILTLDKLEKKGEAAVRKELQEKGVSASSIDVLFDVLRQEGSNEDILLNIQNSVGALPNLQKLQELLAAYDVEYTLNPVLARGLNYYTGVVFEVFDADQHITSSIAAGGRYDSMVGALSNADNITACGISFGVDTVMDCLGPVNQRNPGRTLVIGLTDNYEDMIGFCEDLRGGGASVMLASTEKGFRKNLDYADKEGFEWLIVFGDDERETGEFEVKHLETGEKTSGDFEDIVRVVGA